MIIKAVLPGIAAAIAAVTLFVILAGGQSSGEDTASVVGGQSADGGDAGGRDNRVELRPENGSGMDGSVSFRESPSGIEVSLDLRNLPEPGSAYIGAIYEGVCQDKGEGQGNGGGDELAGGPVVVFVADFAHGGDEDQDAHEENIVQTLSLVSADSSGRGSSVTPLPGAVDQFFSGSPKYVDVHGEGSRPIACGDLPRRETA